MKITYTTSQVNYTNIIHPQLSTVVTPIVRIIIKMKTATSTYEMVSTLDYPLSDFIQSATPHSTVLSYPQKPTPWLDWHRACELALGLE